jgi:predicted ATP-grasp superfamily ATP-dependent carboligase
MSMLLFLYEYTCATANEDCASSLRAEGRAMLTALCKDFGRIAGISLCTLSATEDEEPAFRKLARSADATLVIAPETDNLLLERCRWVLEEGGRLLGSSPEAVALTGDKLASARHLRRHGVPTPLTVPLTDASEPPSSFPFPMICKPRYGAGSQSTFLVTDQQHLTGCLIQARLEAESVEMILQRFVPGLAASVAFLLGPTGSVALPAAEQHLSGDGRFRYQGGRVPLHPGLTVRAQRLAGPALATVPGLRGYVGVDVVLGENEDQVIEINPRLTTSYVGLRLLARSNLAEALLHVSLGHAAGELDWQEGVVSFRADGSVGERSGGDRRVGSLFIF